VGVLIALAAAAPSEESNDKAAVAPADDKSDDAGKKSGVVVADQTWETWFSQNTWNIATGVIGVVILVGGISLAFYYFYYLRYYSYKGDQGGVQAAAADPYAGYTYRDYSSQAQVAGYPNQYYSTSIGRSLDTSAPSGWNVNWGQVLYMISLAQETYEKFDFRSMDCQKKALCEVAQKQEDFGETGRKISNTFSVLDAVEGLPMPTIIQNYLKEYREAVNQGKNSFKSCAEVYPSCGFSIKEIIAKYQKKAASGKF